MRLLVLGGNGMLGHKLVEILSASFEVHTTIRKTIPEYVKLPTPSGSILEGLDVLDNHRLAVVIKTINPDVIVNAVGIIKQRHASMRDFIMVNSLFPLRLKRLCLERRLVHISTDCVFSGRRGNYTELDNPDPMDIYGISKWAGEACANKSLVLRTSIIGWQVQDFNGLLSWFMKSRGSVKGYTRAIFSGLTSSVLSSLIANVITNHHGMTGVYHVAGLPISKYDLLCGLRDALGLATVIEPDGSFVCDRSLCGDKFFGATHWIAPAWVDMLDGLAREWAGYSELYERKKTP